MTPVDERTRESKLAARVACMVLCTLAMISLFIPQVRELLNSLGLGRLRILVFAFCTAFMVTPLAITLSWKLGWLDKPLGRKDHGDTTPLLGGFAIITAFGLALLVNYHYSIEMKAVGIGGMLIWLVGVIDDRYELPAVLKLLVQLIAASILVYFGVRVTFLPPTLLGNILEIAITLIWVIGITNAVNFLDGMDGLATGMSAIISLFLALVALQTGQGYFAWVALAMLGACLGFLPFNFRWKKRARIFLGDSGATFLGFTLAAAVIMGDWAENDTAKIAVPLLLMGVPIFDMTMTTIIRFGTGKVKNIIEWFVYTGRDHFHHRLASLGIGRQAAVITIWVLTMYLGLSSVVLKGVTGFYAILILFQAAILFGFVSFFMIYVRTHQIRLFIREASERDNNNSFSEADLSNALKASDCADESDSQE